MTSRRALSLSLSILVVIGLISGAAGYVSAQEPNGESDPSASPSPTANDDPSPIGSPSESSESPTSDTSSSPSDGTAQINHSDPDSSVGGSSPTISSSLEESTGTSGESSPCVGGARDEQSIPSGPASSQSEAVCSAQRATFDLGGRVEKNPKGYPEPHPGIHWLGTTSTSAYSSQGVYGALNVVDPSVRRGTYEYLSQRFLAKSCDATQWLEAGWAEPGWRALDDPQGRQYIYTYNSVTRTWNWFDQYPVAPGSRVYFQIYDWGNVWQAWLWWNGGWQVLDTVSIDGLNCIENFVETDSGNTSHFPFPPILAGDGGTGGVQIADGNGQFRTWDTSIPTILNSDDGSGYFSTRVRGSYYDFDVAGINSAPIASLTISPSEGTRATTFTADGGASWDPNSDCISALLEWGDGSTNSWNCTGSPSQFSWSHQYASLGTKTVRLTVTDEWRATNSRSVNVKVVNTPPNVTVSLTPSTGNRATTFSASVTATDPDGDSISPSSYRIEWGDGRIAYSQSATTKWWSVGNYSVRGYACDSHGACAFSSPVSARVEWSNSAPILNFNVSPQTGGLTTTFSASMWGTSDPEGDPLHDYEIDWGDGTFSGAISASHRYARQGSYQVTATVTDEWGLESTAVRTVDVSGTASAGTTSPSGKTLIRVRPGSSDSKQSGPHPRESSWWSSPRFRTITSSRRSQTFRLCSTTHSSSI